MGRKGFPSEVTNPRPSLETSTLGNAAEAGVCANASAVAAANPTKISLVFTEPAYPASPTLETSKRARPGARFAGRSLRLNCLFLYPPPGYVAGPWHQIG